MSGLMYPKTPAKKKRKKHAKSIIQERDGTCYLCRLSGNWYPQYVHKHHIFDGNPDRSKSEEWGLTVDLCVNHHTLGPDAVHNNIENMRFLQRIGQQAFEELYGHDKFIEVFKENYL